MNKPENLCLQTDITPRLNFLQSWDWWCESFNQSLKFAHLFIAPAFILAIANTVLVAVNYFVASGAKTLEPDLAKLMLLALVCLSALVVCLVLSLWALGLWLFRLTAYARCLVLSEAPTLADYTEAVNYTRKRKAYLAKLWLVASLILLPPLLPLSLLIAFNVIAAGNYTIEGVPMLELPNWLHYAAPPVIALLSVFCLVYTLVTLVLSSVSTSSPAITAIAAFKQCFKHFLKIFTVTVVVLLVNIIISCPQVVINWLVGSSQAALSLPSIIVQQLWLGVTSLVLWPWSLIPYSKMIHANRRNHS